ncbi:MAG: pyridoxal 5'-phosphate synthase glutaminase subunit PdxT [Anaerolineaceae bacterium]|nr:pyridoxal 5'-phosphate synthase glutaminase subunit PdxT [Anaerolineaceae bacterium]
MSRIGVLALQGAFLEHQVLLERLGAEVVQVRLPAQLDGLDGLIIPGGESTTIGKLAVAYGLLEPLREFGRHKALWGTCAGAIFLAKDIGLDQPILGLMDISIRRNAFGRQVDSFETNLRVDFGGSNGSQAQPFRAVFIRAPLIEAVHGAARPLAQLEDGRIVAAREGRLLATVFHPELTSDDRFHRYFLEMTK